MLSSKKQVEKINESEIKGRELQAGQLGMYVFKQFHPDSTHHHTIAMNMTGPLNKENLRLAMLVLMERHEGLRSSFITSHSKPYQVFKEFKTTPTWPIKMINGKDIVGNPPIEELPAVLEALKAEDVLQKFNLEEGPLWRSALVQFDENNYQFLLVFDHIIIDAASQNVFLEELGTIYNALSEKKSEFILPEKPPLDSIKLEETKSDEKMRYWERKLTDYTPLDLLTDFPAPKTFGFKGNRINFGFSAADIKRINACIENINQALDAKENKITLYMFLLASLYVLLYRYTDSTDLCIGTPDANKSNYNFKEKELSHVVSCFIDNLPLRIDLSGNPSFLTILKRVRDMVIEAHQNQLPLTEIMEKAFKGNKEITTLSDVIFVLNEPKKKLNLKHLVVSDPVELNLKNTKFKYFGLNLDTHAAGNADGFIEFNTELFNANYFKRFIGHWQTALRAAVKQPHTPLSELPILTETEKKQLNEFNKTEKKSGDKFTHELFSIRAKEHPRKTALIYHDESGNKQVLNWKTLDEETNRIAAVLKHMGIRPGKTVGVSISRSPELIIALLAIHKAGATFVPLETLPSALLNFKMDNADMSAVLVDTHSGNLFKRKPSLKLLNIKDRKKIDKLIARYSLKYKKQWVSEKAPASIYFTSGSTGQPKGVVVNFGGQKNLLDALADRKPAPGTKYLCAADIISDASWFDITNWITTERAELHLINAADRFDAPALTRIIQKEKINVIVLVPNVLEKLNPEDLPSVKIVISEGAPPAAEMLERWKKAGVEIRNEWGPTEATVCSSQHICAPNEPTKDIGGPIRNGKFHIVDRYGNTCPIGVPGELVVEGKGLATGYYKNPELTKKMFPLVTYNTRSLRLEKLPTNKTKEIKGTPLRREYKNQKTVFTNKLLITKRRLGFKTFNNKDRKVEVKKVYRTGDLVSRTENGHIVFIDRIDNQIKIKGTRIELDKVNSTLRSHPAIAEVYTIKHPSKDFLVAYVVLKKNESLKENKLGDSPGPDKDIPPTLAELNKLLSQEALPSVARLCSVMYISAIPLKSVGKVDTGALPLPIEPEEKITLPQNLLQDKLLKIWLSIFPDTIPKDKISINDSFAAVGGDSPMLFKLITKLNNGFRLATSVKPHELTMDITIEDLEKLIKPRVIGTFDVEKSAESKNSHVVMGFSAANVDKINHTSSSLWSKPSSEGSSLEHESTNRLKGGFGSI